MDSQTKRAPPLLCAGRAQSGFCKSPRAFVAGIFYLGFCSLCLVIDFMSMKMCSI